MRDVQVMMGFIKEWADKLGVKIVCSQVRMPGKTGNETYNETYHAVMAPTCTVNVAAAFGCLLFLSV